MTKVILLAKDLEIVREHTIKVGASVEVPVHIAKQLEAQGFVAVKPLNTK